MPLEKCVLKYVFVPGYGYFKPWKMGFTNSIEHPHERAWWWHFDISPSTRFLLLVSSTLCLQTEEFSDVEAFSRIDFKFWKKIHLHLSLLLGGRLAGVLLLLGLLGRLARGLGLLLLLVVRLGRHPQSWLLSEIIDKWENDNQILIIKLTCWHNCAQGQAR